MKKSNGVENNTDAVDKRRSLKKIWNEIDEGIKEDVAKLLESRYKFTDNALFNNIAITVFAGYNWATKRNFDEIFDEDNYEEDNSYAIDLLTNKYEGMLLEEVINEMIDRQAELIYLRRKYDGLPDPPDSYNVDRFEAKRFVAYLFFDKILYDCVKDRICPDFCQNISDEHIINLLKSLTIEEFCKIKAYTSFIKDREFYGEGAFNKDDHNYFNALKELEKSFQNCKCRKCARIQEYELKWQFEEKNSIIKAKKRVEDRVGYIQKRAVKDFVEKYYSFIEQIKDGINTKKDAEELLRKIYDYSNTKIVNMLEYMLKCMISSYIEESTYNSIRMEAGMPKKIKLDSKKMHSNQEKPIWA